MECPICFNIISNSCIGSCTHHYCFECLLQWCKKDGKNCPKCKEPIYQIKLDKEFDLINNPNDTKIIVNEPYFHFIEVKYYNTKTLGITLKNNKGPGLIVAKLSKNMACDKAGLNTGDIIFDINNIPCNDHKYGVELLEKNYNVNKKLVLKIFKILKN